MIVLSLLVAAGAVEGGGSSSVLLPCSGDCDADGDVEASEVQAIIIEALAGVPSLCIQGQVPSVDDAVKAVLSRGGCASATPTPTATPTATQTSMSCAPLRTVTPSAGGETQSECRPVFAEHPNLLWLPEDGSLTNGGRYLNESALKAEIDRACPTLPFDFVFVSSSRYDRQLLASRGGGIAVYLTVCDTETSGLVQMQAGRRLCDEAAGIQGMMGLLNLNYWIAASDGERRFAAVHELGHRWGALALTSTPGTRIGMFHWRCLDRFGIFDCFQIDSVMGERSSTPLFAMLDLYLMGMASVAEVPTYDYIDAQGLRIPVTIDSIIAATGVREPAYPDAPTDFSLGWVVLTPDDRLPDACELGLAQSWSEQFPGWWSAATQGRSTVSFGFPPRSE